MIRETVLTRRNYQDSGAKAKTVQSKLSVSRQQKHNGRMVNKGAASFDCTLVLRKNLGFFSWSYNKDKLSPPVLHVFGLFSLFLSFCIHLPAPSPQLLTDHRSPPLPPDCGEYPRYHAIDIMCKTAMQLMYITILGNV